jgi:hypothetical protein
VVAVHHEEEVEVEVGIVGDDDEDDDDGAYKSSKPSTASSDEARQTCLRPHRSLPLKDHVDILRGPRIIAPPSRKDIKGSRREEIKERMKKWQLGHQRKKEAQHPTFSCQREKNRY